MEEEFPGANQAKYDEKPLANCDMESHLQTRILTAMLMAIEVRKLAKVGADEHLWNYGLRGIAEGCAREIIEELGMRPEFLNIRPIFKPGYEGPIPEHMMKHFANG
jgi:hypothetical protein